jgi:anthranilate/para-aminobenzoate synthase component I
VATAVVTIDDPGIVPREAYARLRTYTPGRASFLLESSGGGPEARYSIVAYRTRRSEIVPPGQDAIEVQAAALDALPIPGSLAAAIAEGAFGFISAACATLRAGIRPFDDETAFGWFGVGSTVLLYDHEAGTVTVAAPAQGRQIERILYELDRGPAPAALPPLDPSAAPPGLRQAVPDDKLRARAERVKPFLGDELQSVALAQTFTVPQGEADPFAAYRALRELGSAVHGYYCDFGESPVQGPLCLFGTSDTLLHLSRRDAPADARTSLRAALPHASITGSPALVAARVTRRLEDQSRQQWGGAVGYWCPGGEAAFVLGDRLVAVSDGSFWCTASARVDADTDAERVPELARAAAGRELAALAAALVRA